MATAPTHPVIRYVRQLAAAHPAAELPDRELLGRFLGRRDEAAFAALVRRHGPMVLGVSRRVLHDWHAAEDVLQATFLLLARRAGSIRRRESLAAWLHAVAFKTALKAKARAARRRACERRAAAPEAARPDDLVWRDLRPVLDEAVDSLPEKYRLPFVLCYLQGRSVSEAARQLGCPRGTVAANLARGRQRLRARLTRRGVVLSAAVLGAALCRRAGAATTPLTGRALGAVLSVAAGDAAGGVAPAGVAALTKGVFRAMTMTTFKVAGAVLLAGVVGLGVTAGVYTARATGPGGAARGAPRAAPPGEPADRPAAYVIEPPDILLVRGSAKLSRVGQPLDGERLVRPDGTISLGASGAVPVAGLSTDQAADAIAGQLTRAGAVKGLSPEQVRDELTVEVMAYNSKFLYVITNHAGLGDQVFRFPLTGSETVLDAVAQVDGLPAVAGRCRVWVERRGAGDPPKVLPVDWSGISQRGEARTNYALRPGDRIHVEAEETGGAAPEGAAGGRPAETEIDRRLRSAFGDDGGGALAAAIRWEVRSRRLVLAANCFRVEADGRVELAPCWLVQGGGAGRDEAPERVALRCREAFLTFDGPVRSPADVGRRRVTAIEPVGDVRITFPSGAPQEGGRTPAAHE